MPLHGIKVKVATALVLLSGIVACNRSTASDDPSPAPSTAGSTARQTGTGTGPSTSSTGKGQNASVSNSSKTTSVTYANWAREYLESTCVKCHSRGKNEPDLSTEASARAAAKESLESMEEDRMPPRGPESQDLKKMKEWVAGGAK